MWRWGLLGVVVGVTGGAALALWATGSPGYLLMLVLVPSLALPLVITVFAAAGALGRPARQEPRAPRPVWARRAVAVGAALVAAALVVLPVGGHVARDLRDTVTGDFGADDTITGRYQQEAVDALAEVVGGYEFTSVGFYDGYVIVTAPTTPGARTTDTFTYRYGSAERDGPELIQPASAEELRAELFDASRVDFSRIPALVAQAEQLSGITEPTSVLPQVRRERVQVAGEGVDMIVVSVSLSDDYWNATVTSRLDGSVVRTSGSAFRR